MEDILYLAAMADDETPIKALLTECQLPSEDITGLLPNFVVARSGTRVVGVIGLEICGEYGLLRSLAVSPDFRGRGIAGILHTHIFTLAKQYRLRELYLLTNTASEYARRFGFGRVDRNRAPQSIQNSAEFQTLCPQTTALMMSRHPTSG